MDFSVITLCSQLLFLCLDSAFGVNILYAATIASPSHYIWNRIFAVALAEKGYNVTFVGPDKDKDNVPKPKNLHHILLEGLYESLDESFDVNDMANLNVPRMMKEFQDWSLHLCGKSMKTQGLQRLLNYPPDFRFDLIILDVSIDTCFYPLIEKFNYPPTVGVSIFLLPPYVSYNFGNHLFPSYIPWYGLPHNNEMSFTERVWNFVYTNLDIIVRNTMQYEEDEKIGKEVFIKNVAGWKQLQRHISLVLANTDSVLNYPQPLPPNIVAVGGLHTRKSRKLPEELQVLLDNAKNGAILFSLGTNIRSDKLKENQKRDLLEAFSHLNETVIWKYESPIENLPKNVIVRKWLPQNDLLGHPNMKLFIGHGGALSTQEAIFHGVPIVAVPFIVDQYLNTRIVVHKKLGVQLDAKLISPTYVLNKLLEVLNDPMYLNNVRLASKRFKDQPETPLERGIFWIEYVMRHGGADFLNTPARDMPFYVSSGADVMIFLLSILVVVCIVLYKLIVLVLGTVNRRKKLKIN